MVSLLPVDYRRGLLKSEDRSLIGSDQVIRSIYWVRSVSSLSVYVAVGKNEKLGARSRLIIVDVASMSMSVIILKITP